MDCEICGSKDIPEVFVVENRSGRSITTKEICRKCYDPLKDEIRDRDHLDLIRRYDGQNNTDL